MREQLLSKVRHSRIILALDNIPADQISLYTNELAPLVAGAKATDLIDACGAGVFSNSPFSLRFLDPKINDIPATVSNRVTRYAGYADILTVHASMSDESLRAAARAGKEHNIAVVAVTVLTSISSEECVTIFGDIPERVVQKFALRAQAAELAGIVCSALEAPLVRSLWPDSLIITPGVRSSDANSNDQSRTATPAKAIQNGADFVVCGRQITSLPTPATRQAEVEKINQEILSAKQTLARPLRE